jgi:hypothetical protein
MPAISTLPWAMVLAHAGAGGASTYYINPEDCTVVIQQIPNAGLTIFLPGPPGLHSRRPPDDGDWYIIADPLGQLGGEQNTPQIDGQGFTINGALTFHMPNVTFGWVAFQFDAANKDWILVQGGVA